MSIQLRIEDLDDYLKYIKKYQVDLVAVSSDMQKRGEEVIGVIEICAIARMQNGEIDEYYYYDVIPCPTDGKGVNNYAELQTNMEKQKTELTREYMKTGNTADFFRGRIKIKNEMPGAEPVGGEPNA